MKRLYLKAALLVLALLPGLAAAQDLRPRVGLGFNTLLSTPDGLGFGLRTRISAPINADLSAAADLGFTGFVLDGRNNATYIFDPQVSLVITLPGRGSRAPYVLAGVGAYTPLSDKHGGETGPTIHLGLGMAQRLNETSFFYEVDPAFIIGENSVGLAVPLRIGVIF